MVAGHAAPFVKRAKAGKDAGKLAGALARVPRYLAAANAPRATAGAPRKRPTLARGAFWAGQAGAEGAGQGRNSTQNLRMAFGEFEKRPVLLKNPHRIRPTLPSGEGGFN